MAEDREVLGEKHNHGRVRSLRGNGETLPAAAGNDPQERQGERRRCPVAVRLDPDGIGETGWRDAGES